MLSRSGSDGALRVDPAEVRDSALAGSTLPRQVGVQVSGGGGWQATEDTPWITVSPRSGSSQSLITIALDPWSLSPGTHEGAVTIRAPHPDVSAATIPVTLVILQPVLKVEPKHVTYESRSSTVAFSDTLLITNEGNGPLTWTATTTNHRSWLTLGNVAGGAPGEIPVILSGPVPLFGTFRDTIVVTAPGAKDSPAKIVVTLRRRRN